MTITDPTTQAGVDGDAAAPAAAAYTGIHVTKRDGTREPYNADRINKAIERAAEGLEDQISKTTQVATELGITLFDGITRHTKEGYDFQQRAAKVGFKEAVRERDEPFGDFGPSTFKG